MPSSPAAAAAPRAVSVAELERIAALGWRGDTMTWRGDWLLRAGGGFTGRANSALILGAAPDSLDAALDAVASFYTDLGLDPRIALPEGVPAGAEAAAALAAHGWSAGPPVLVMTAYLPHVLAAAPLRADLARAVLEPSPSPQWLDGYRYRGGPAPGNARPVLLGADRPIFATVSAAADRALAGPAVGDPTTTRPGAVTLGVARGVVDQGWLGISAVTVDEARRRLGVGTHLLGELARWAASQRAHSVYLQVDAANRAAVRLYAGRGFVVHHRYAYWSPGG